jgi:predicted RNase H-like HicB family nuclease
MAPLAAWVRVASSTRKGDSSAVSQNHKSPLVLTLIQEIDKIYQHRGKGMEMELNMTMVYWKSDKFWLGKLLEHPEIMTQGESLEELEENIKDAYLLMALDEVPEKYETKKISI